MNKLNNDRVWKIRPATLLRVSLIAMVGMLGASAGCTAPDSHSGDAMRAANTGDELVKSARTKCPGAKQAIAEADAAAQAAHAAGDAVLAAGGAVDEADKQYEAYVADAEKANVLRSNKEQAAKAMKDKMAAADADWQKANEEYEGYKAQAMAAGIDTSAANLNGALDRMKAGVEVPVALANAANAKAKRDAFEAKHNANKKLYGDQAKALEADADQAYRDAIKAQNYRDKKKAELEAARAKYHAAVDDANAKTIASRAANSRLAAACPDAQGAVYPQDTRLPGSQPPGLDIFQHTTSQGQEPPSDGGHHHEN